MNTPKYSFPTILVASLFVLISSVSHAATLVNDNFTLSSGSSAGTISNTSSTGIGTYSTIQGTNGMTVTTQSGFGSGNVLSLALNSNTYYRAFDTAGCSLNSLSVGDTLSLSYSIRFSGNPDGTAQNFSFGFVNSSSANSIIYANVDLNQNSATASEFRYRTGSFNMSDAGTVIGNGFASSALTGSTNYTFGLNVTKQSGQFLLEYLRDGVVVGSVIASASSGWATAEADATITGIAFRHSVSPNVTTYLDNVSVITTSAVPEPSTFALLGGLGALGFVVSRRRR